jgi:hypothetical protein
MNLIQSSALLITGLACLLAGCRSGKVVREDFSKLQRIEVPEVGISFLFLPGKIKTEDRQENLVFALLNPVDEYPDLGQDARVMMKVFFSLTQSPTAADRVTNGVEIYHGAGAPWADVERIVKCQPDRTWRAKISVGRYSIDGHEYFEEDIEIARRILESVECIPTAADADGRVEP